jgi:ferritin-like protein
LYEENVAVLICAVHVGVARHTALVTAGDDLRRYALAQSVVENEILPNKGVLKSLG